MLLSSPRALLIYTETTSFCRNLRNTSPPPSGPPQSSPGAQPLSIRRSLRNTREEMRFTSRRPTTEPVARVLRRKSQRLEKNAYRNGERLEAVYFLLKTNSQVELVRTNFYLLPSYSSIVATSWYGNRIPTNPASAEQSLLTNCAESRWQQRSFPWTHEDLRFTAESKPSLNPSTVVQMTAVVLATAANPEERRSYTAE